MKAPLRLRDLQQILGAMVPLELAADWDNVGWLLEPALSKPIVRIMLTVDLTEAVAKEAIARDCELVIAYHPPIFSPLKRLRASDSKQSAVLRLASREVALFSPHTAMDAMPAGVADWLIKGLVGGNVARCAPCGEGGFGRVAQLARPMSRSLLLARARKLCGVRHLQLGLPAKAASRVTSIAVAAGAGSSVLRGVAADLLLTGEMSHHEVLTAVAAGSTVVLAGHSNTERGFLKAWCRQLRSACQSFCRVEFAASDRDPLRIV